MDDMRTLARKGFYLSRSINAEVCSRVPPITAALTNLHIDNGAVSEAQPAEENFEHRNRDHVLYGSPLANLHEIMRSDRCHICFICSVRPF